MVPRSTRRAERDGAGRASSALASIAFPALGTGIGGFPLDEAARIAVDAVRDELAQPSSIEHVMFALRGAAAYEAFARALTESEPRRSPSLLAPRSAVGARSRRELPLEPVDERREALVEAVAREIRLRGLTGTAVHFLEASRPYRPLGAPAMLFFDPVLRELFGGESPSASELLARRHRASRRSSTGSRSSTRPTAGTPDANDRRGTTGAEPPLVASGR